MQIAQGTQPNLADEERGYEIGCEGMMSIKEARQFLGNCSDDTLEQLFRDGRIRKARICGRRIGICRRSVKEYLKAQEMVP